MLLDGEYIKRITKLAEEEMDATLDKVRETLGTDAVGMSTPSDEQLAAFWFKQQKLYPPQLFTYPDGHQVFASPWILALEFCDNGKDWLAKWDRFQKKAGVLNAAS